MNSNGTPPQTVVNHKLRFRFVVPDSNGPFRSRCFWMIYDVEGHLDYYILDYNHISTQHLHCGTLQVVDYNRSNLTRVKKCQYPEIISIYFEMRCSKNENLSINQESLDKQLVSMCTFCDFIIPLYCT